VNTNGYSTGNNSGVYPDAAMAASFFIADNVTRNMVLSGLNQDKTYDFTFFASRMGATDVRNTIYSIGGKTAVLNASNNTSTTVKITGIKPNEQGQITISATKEATHAFGYIGAMVIREHEEVEEPAAPNKPLSLVSQVLTRNSIRLIWQDASSMKPALKYGSHLTMSTISG
jgi:large repetitive protein